MLKLRGKNCGKMNISDTDDDLFKIKSILHIRNNSLFIVWILYHNAGFYVHAPDCCMTERISALLL